MNTKLLKNFLLSIAFSCIISGSVGHILNVKTYYYIGIESKSEISFVDYRDYKKEGSNYVKRIATFNYDLAIPSLLVSFGAMFIAFTAIRKSN
jgi:hypothetical protein